MASSTALASRKGVVACNTTTRSIGSPRRLQGVHGVGDDGLEGGEVGGQLRRPQERDLRAVGAGHLRHVRVVGRDDDAVHVAAAAGGVDGVGEERAVAQALDVEVGHGVRPAARGDDGDHPEPVLQRGLVTGGISGRAYRPCHPAVNLREGHTNTGGGGTAQAHPAA